MRIGFSVRIRRTLCPWSGSGAFFGCEIANGMRMADGESNQLRIPVTTRRRYSGRCGDSQQGHLKTCGPGERKGYGGNSRQMKGVCGEPKKKSEGVSGFLSFSEGVVITNPFAASSTSTLHDAQPPTQR